jgi:hypothetical protein
METLFKDIDRLHKFEKLGVNKREGLMKKYNFMNNQVEHTIETCKQKLCALKARRIRYLQNSQRRRENFEFKSNRKRLFDRLLKRNSENEVKPEKIETESFWKSIWSPEDPHVTEPDNTYPFNEIATTQQEECTITVQDLKRQLRKTANWKAPGHDGLHGFWLKYIPCFHQKLTEALNKCLKEGIPEIFTSGRTVLIQKDTAKGNAASNYRPITCLPIIWKTLTGMISDKIYQYLDDNQLIPEEQKGCIKNSQATKSQLKIDKEIMDDARTKKKNLSMCWIDYQKAYDMVPHNWIIKTLKWYGIAKNLISFIANSMKTWKVSLHHGRDHICNIHIRRGIFQGDSLSPLLFIISLFPLSHILRNSNYGFRKTKDPVKPISHLLYMDDIKLFGKNSKELHNLISIVKDYSDRMKMSFGLEKCKIVHVKRGVLDTSNGEEFILEEDKTIQTLRQHENEYKYLGILELDQIKHNKMKEQLKAEYVKRVKAILSSQLTARNKITTINTLAVPVMRYSGGVVKWTRLELQEIDRKTRKLITIHRGLAMRADVDRLYTSRNEGGRGLLSVEETVRLEETRMQTAQKDNKAETISAVQNMKEAMKKKRYDGWKQKPMHGQYIRQFEDNVDVNRTFQWLRKSDFTIESEGFITAAQDQAIQTRNIAKNIYHTAPSDKCRMCNKHVESVTHILAECPFIAQTLYMERHNQVAAYIHWKLSKLNALETEYDTWTQHTPRKIIENSHTKMLWDCNIFTDNKISARRPDIVVINKTTNSGLIIDINCPNDRNVCVNEIKKMHKYSELKIEVERIWKIHFEIVPIVIGCLGAVSKSLPHHLKRIGLNHSDIAKLQEITLLSSCRILRMCVTQSGIPL